MPNRNNFNLNFRPTTYWDDPVKMLLANIKGEHRRRKVLQFIRDGQIDQLDEWLIAEKVDDDLRQLLGRIHPKYMGGEYLPDSLDGEVEIARVSLNSTTGDVTSVRARPEGSRIKYSIRDEYDSIFWFSPTESNRPLTMGELVSLMDGAKSEEWDGGKGLTRFYRNMNFEIEREADPSSPAENLRDFATVTSEYYPELQRWYTDEAAEWVREMSKSRGRQ